LVWALGLRVVAAAWALVLFRLFAFAAALVFAALDFGALDFDFETLAFRALAFAALAFGTDFRFLLATMRTSHVCCRRQRATTAAAKTSEKSESTNRRKNCRPNPATTASYPERVCDATVLGYVVWTPMHRDCRAPRRSPG
jgi:hypothetical protein